MGKGVARGQRHWLPSKEMARSLSHFLGVSYFVNPLPLAAVALMVLNDHYLKWQFANGLTGKISDFTGLFFFPLFLCALYCLLRNVISRARGDFFWITPRRLAACILLTDLIFIGIKFSPEVRDFYIFSLRQIGQHAAVVPDVTDLWALLANALTFWFARSFFEKQ